MRNSTTIGFVPESDGRGTVGIIWQNSTVIFLCVCTVLHFDIPRKPLRWTTWCEITVPYLIKGLGVPELIAFMAYREWANARLLRKVWAERLHERITSKQAFFLMAGGIRVECEDSQQRRYEFDMHEFLRLEKERKSGGQLHLAKFLECFHEELPSDEEIDADSKADVLSKLITCVQSMWLLLQIINRLQKGLDVCLLEVLSAGFIISALIAYGFWYQKPYRIGHAKLSVWRQGLLSFPDAEKVVYHRTKDHWNLEWGWTTFHSKFRRLMLPVGGDCLTPLQMLPFSATGIVLAAIHCSAWNYPFPTSVEAWLWRVCSVLLGVLPLLNCVTDQWHTWMEGHIGDLHRRGRKHSASLWEIVQAWYFKLVYITYAAARLFILIEVCVSLRKAPVGIYQDLGWSSYLIHLG